MAVSPTKPDFMDVTSRGKVRVWVTPTIATSDTVQVSGVKKIFQVVVGSRPTTTWTSSSAGNGNGTVVTLTITASCTGGATPLVIYGQ